MQYDRNNLPKLLLIKKLFRTIALLILAEYGLWTAPCP